MLGKNTPVFLLIPKAGQHKKILHAGTVIEANATAFTAEFEDAIAPAVGADVVAYGEESGKFFQQGASVTAILADDPHPIITFTRIGEAVSAEQRQTFRVSTVTLDLCARINKEESCQLVDISPEGFGAIVKAKLEVGEMVQISIAHERHAFSAAARVQTVKDRPDGKFRYGFLVPSRNPAARKTLESISSTAQRAQLRRLAGVT